MYQALNAGDTYSVFRLHPSPDAHDFYRQLAGRFAFVNGELWILEDPLKVLEGFGLVEGPVGEDTLEALARLKEASYYDVVKQADRDDGSHPDSIKDAEFDDNGTLKTESEVAPRRPASVFSYQRTGMSLAQTLEVAAGRYLLNAQELTPDEVKTVLENVRRGLAVLRYKQDMATPIQKMESVFEDLLKAEHESDEDIHGVMRNLKDLAAKGHINPQHLKLLHHELYGDQLVHDVGNKRAYRDFLSRPRAGAHVMMDLNNLKNINDQLGHQAGDQAIAHAGQAMREAMDETVGRKKGKLFRIGGDEFAAHIPSHDDAAIFARALRSKLEALPPIAGTHRVGVSMGIGHTPAVADVALINHAKAAKLAASVGSKLKGAGVDDRLLQAPDVLYAHSLYSGREGKIPTGASMKPTLPKMGPPQRPVVEPLPPAQPAIAVQQAPAPQPQAPQVPLPPPPVMTQPAPPSLLVKKL